MVLMVMRRSLVVDYTLDKIHILLRLFSIKGDSRFREAPMKKNDFVANWIDSRYLVKHFLCKTLKRSMGLGFWFYRILILISCKGVPSSSCRSVIVSAGNEKFLIRQQTPISLATTPFSHSMTPILHNTTHILDTSSEPWLSHLLRASWHKSNLCSVTYVPAATY